MEQGAEIDELLTALVAGKLPPMRLDGGGLAIDTFASRLRLHGVAGLLSKNRAALRDLPKAVTDAIEAEARQQAIIEASRIVVLKAAAQALHEAGVEHVFLKGACLAYSIYADAADRARGDTDLLVREGQYTAASEALRGIGFAEVFHGRDGFGQASWQSAPEFGMRHDLDVHWKLSNSPALAALFTQDPFASSRSLPRLSSHARGMDNLNLLLHLALNQALHDSNGLVWEGRTVKGVRRLVWSYDIHLLAKELTEDDWAQLADTAVQSGTAPVIGRALLLAETRLGTQIPGAIMARLHAAPRENWLTRYIERPDLGFRLRCDVRAAKGPLEACALLFQHAFPPERRLRERFPDKPSWPVWALRLLRAAQAPIKWLRKPRTG